MRIKKAPWTTIIRAEPRVGDMPTVRPRNRHQRRTRSIRRKGERRRMKDLFELSSGKPIEIGRWRSVVTIWLLAGQVETKMRARTRSCDEKEAFLFVRVG